VTFTVPALGAHTAAVLACLTAALGALSPAVPVQVGRKKDDQIDVHSKHAVIWPLSPDFDGPVGDYAADLTYAFQVTSVGETVDQAEWVADRVRAALIAGPITIAGRAVEPVRPTGGPPVQRDDDISPPMYYRAETYELCTSPA
jgi:hypothetical protein